MAFPKIKVCWRTGAIDAEWRLGVVGWYRRGNNSRLRGLAISLRGLLAWCAALALVGYFSAAGALYWWFQRKPHNAITYADLVLPTRWSELKSLRGRSMIAEGIDDIKARRWGEGLAKLRVGIERHPDDIEGRRVLADLFILMRARRQAMEVLDGGLERAYPGRAYVEAMLQLAAQGEDHVWWLSICERALAKVRGRPDLEMERRWLVQRKMDALIEAGRPAEAVALADAEGEQGGPVTDELHVLALLKADRAADAVAFLERWAARSSPRASEQVVRLKARAYREAGNIEAMSRALEQLRALAPAHPRPYVFAVVQTWLAGRPEEARAQIDRFLLRFGSNAGHVLLLASAMADVAGPEVFGRLVAHARDHGFNPGPFVQLRVSALLKTGAVDEAASVLASSPPPSSSGPEARWLELMRARIEALRDPSEAAQSKLVSLIRERHFKIQFYREVITGLRAAGRDSTAREVVTFAQGVYPTHPLLEQWRKELDVTLAAAEAAKPVVQVARPATVPSARIDVSTRKTVTEAEYRDRAEELLKAGDFTAAAGWLRETRLSKPDWFAARAGELAAEEIRLAGRAGDLLGMRPLVRLFNNGDLERTSDLLRIARELHAAGRGDEATFVLREVLAKSPDVPAARKLLSEWLPASEDDAKPAAP